MKKWLRLIPFCVLLIMFCVFNYFVDPGNVICNINKDVAKLVLEGNNVYVRSANLDMQGLKKELLIGMPMDTEAVCIGASPLNGLGKDAVDANSYKNLAISGAGYYDMVALFGLMEIYEKHPRKVILFLDPGYFSEVMYEHKLVRAKKMKPYAYYMLELLNGKDVTEITPPDYMSEFLNVRDSISNMFSVSYFQSSINYVIKNGGFSGVRYSVIESDSDDAYFMSDGSLMYDINYRSQSVEDVIADAKKYENNYMFNSLSGQPMSNVAKETLQKLVEYYGDIEFELFLAPFAPALYDIYDKNKYYIFSDIENYCDSLTKRYTNVKVIGSYNPYRFGMSNEDFYDSRHIRRDALKRYFNF